MVSSRFSLSSLLTTISEISGMNSNTNKIRRTTKGTRATPSIRDELTPRRGSTCGSLNLQSTNRNQFAMLAAMENSPPPSPPIAAF
ncbi:hypothetical protein JAAARDRAFT_31460 [Jaapia argillacea MUCL 33604]|uniref:Uncharacterized protein n=1 Tax=Jaapia argillacea MUCL 33604 TaxID=933084 RepID=A0A067Q4K3_9AGAM|nr:hypothetical protein JAAARDRAFT_31460 [Jaapia argillacea MUCL 33604]